MAEAAVIKRLTDGAEGLSNGRLGHLRAGETPVEGWSEAGGGGETLAGVDEGMETHVCQILHRAGWC